MDNKFYFYEILEKLKDDQSINWETVFETLSQETTNKTPHNEEVGGYQISVRVLKKSDFETFKLYAGYILLGEEDKQYKIEKNCDFFDLDLDDGELLCHTQKGKLYFLFIVSNGNKPILMLEKIHFMINIRGVLNYFQKRYSDAIEKIDSKTILGKDLVTAIKNMKDDKIKLAKFYFKKSIPTEQTKQFGYVEDAIPNLLEKGIQAELILHFITKPKVADFFALFTKKSFDEALDVDFGQLMRSFYFETDNTMMPKIDMLDKIISYTLPLDKADYQEDALLTELENYFKANKDKLV